MMVSKISIGLYIRRTEMLAISGGTTDPRSREQRWHTKKLQLRSDPDASPCQLKRSFWSAGLKLLKCYPLAAEPWITS